jgi:hypothetical protein
MLATMQFVAERILPAYLDALDRALEDAVARLPEGALRATLMRLRRRGGQRELGTVSGRYTGSPSSARLRAGFVRMKRSSSGNWPTVSPSSQ